MDPPNPNLRRENVAYASDSSVSSNTSDSGEESNPSQPVVNNPPVGLESGLRAFDIMAATPEQLFSLIRDLYVNVNSIASSVQALTRAQEQANLNLENTRQGIADALAQARFELPERPEGPLGPRPPKPPHLTESTFPKLHIGTKDDNISKFHSWEVKVIFQIRANPSYDVVGPAALFSGILTSMQGSAESVAADVNPDSFATLDAFMDHLRAAICGGAVAEKAMVLFMNARQRDNDDITAYGNALENLWRRAYPNQADRSVSMLRKQFLSGLRDLDVADEIIKREQGIPAVFRDLRDLAVAISSRHEIVKQNRIMNKNVLQNKGGQGNHHKNLPVEKKGGPEPMECDHIAAHKGNKERKDPAKDRREAAKKNEFKGIHAGSSEKKGFNPQGQKGPIKPNFQVGGEQKPMREGPCFECKGPHRVANCPKKRGLVGAITETYAEEDEEDFPPAYPSLEEGQVASIGYTNEQRHKRAQAKTAQKRPLS